MNRIMICVRSRQITEIKELGLTGKTVAVTKWTCKAQEASITPCPHCGPHEEKNACKYKVEGPFICDGVCTDYDIYMASRGHKKE